MWKDMVKAYSKYYSATGAEERDEKRPDPDSNRTSPK
jgi:hypothetical protein